MTKKILPKGTKLWVQELPACIHYGWYPAKAGTAYMKKQIGCAFGLIVESGKNNMFTYSYHEPDMIKVSKFFFENQLKDSDYTKKLVRKWEKLVGKFYRVCGKIGKTRLEELSGDDFAKLYHDLKEAYLEEYAVPLISDAIGYFCEVEVKKRLGELLDKKSRQREFNRCLVMLTSSTQDSFIGEEKYELMKIGKKFLDDDKLKDLLRHGSSEILKKLPRPIKKEIIDHAKRYFWIQNNYLRSIVLDELHFVERIKDHLKDPCRVVEFVNKRKARFKGVAEDKQRLLDELDAPHEFRELIKMIDEHASWQDLRKKANLIANHYVSLFLKETSRRKKIAFETLCFVTPEELDNFLYGEKLDWKVVELRKKVVGAIFTPDKVTICNYSDAFLLEKEVGAQIKTEGITDLYGTTANVGKVMGRVRVLMGPEGFKNMVKGEILVTSMTRPEFIPILSKAAAIITDEGSLTCHAAIVSREMDIPCIVGTKIATKVLKDGDIVEVNANHGVVKILKES